MDNTEQLIAIYHTGFIVSIIVMCIGLALAVLFFFLFDIRNIFLIRSGRAEQKSISEMQARNLQTGKLSSSPYTDSGEIRRKKEKRKTGAFRSQEKKPGPVIEPAKQPAELTEALQDSPVFGQVNETSILSTPNNNISSDETLFEAASSQFEAQSSAAPEVRAEQKIPARAASDFKFTVTERTIVIHTNESI